MSWEDSWEDVMNTRFFNVKDFKNIDISHIAAGNFSTAATMDSATGKQIEYLFQEACRDTASRR